MANAHDALRAEADEAQRLSRAIRSLGATAYGWAVLLLALPAIGMVFVSRSLTQAEGEVAKQELAERVTRLEALRKADREALGRYRWIDRDKGVIALPIERAMELEGERLRSKAVGPSTVPLPGALLRQPPSPAPKP